MIVKRTDHEGPERRNSELAVMTESLRSADLSNSATDEPLPPPKAKKTDEEHMSLFWRVFGGTILSISALIMITLYNNLASNISEVRADLARMNEAKGEFAKKDDLNALRLQTTTHSGYRSEIDNLRERASKHRLELDDTKKTLSASIEALKKDLVAVEVLRERQISLIADVKSTRDDLSKLRTELDKNIAADQERRERREVQAKQIDETLKEISKALQETREKLARLEGQQGPAKTNESTPPKQPSAPSKSGTSDENR